ncbi:MAG: hypothetical protein VYE73_07420 [Acidobacteriota bacterium]|nr:hypothetical protein [Acidobacteriota bacterium]
MISFQLLDTRVEVVRDDPVIDGGLRYLAHGASSEVVVRRTIRYAIEGSGPWLLREEGDAVDVLEDPDDLLWFLFVRVHGRVCERYSLAGWSTFHAAVAGVRGVRLLFVGPSSVGKSTLASTLLFGGHSVEGDEMAFERAGVVVPLARRFHLKEGIERHVSGLAPWIDDLPAVRRDGAPVRAFDPSEHGFEWRVRSAPVDAVVCLRAEHGGESRLREITTFEALTGLLGGALNWVQSRSVLVAAATRLARARRVELTLGRPSETLAALESWCGSIDGKLPDTDGIV